MNARRRRSGAAGWRTGKAAFYTTRDPARQSLRSRSCASERARCNKAGQGRRRSRVAGGVKRDSKDTDLLRTLTALANDAEATRKGEAARGFGGAASVAVASGTGREKRPKPQAAKKNPRRGHPSVVGCSRQHVKA